MPDSENGRYSFSTVADGMLRLDTRTGAVSICAKKDFRLGMHYGAGRTAGARERDRTAAA